MQVVFFFFFFADEFSEALCAACFVVRLSSGQSAHLPLFVFQSVISFYLRFLSFILAPTSFISRLLIVDDERHITDLLRFNLEAESFAVTVRESAADIMAMDLAEYRLVIADAMGQKYTGFDLLADIKAHPIFQNIPEIILSHADGEDAIIRAFDLGADDYILKPFSLRELVARIRSVLRRHLVTDIANQAVISFKGMDVDILNKQVRINGELVHLTRTEYAILVLLLKHRNRFYNRRQIFDQVWRDADPSANDRIVDTNISRLRKKLGASAEALVNRTGEGYALID